MNHEEYHSKPLELWEGAVSRFKALWEGYLQHGDTESHMGGKVAQVKFSGEVK